MEIIENFSMVVIVLLCKTKEAQQFFSDGKPCEARF